MEGVASGCVRFWKEFYNVGGFDKQVGVLGPGERVEVEKVSEGGSKGEL